MIVVSLAFLTLQYSSSVAAAFVVTPTVFPPPQRSHLYSSNTETEPVVVQSTLLGDITRIRSTEDESFLSTNAVPTYAASTSSTTQQHQFKCNVDQCKSGGLEGVLRQGPAFVVDHVIPESTCNELIHLFEEELGFGTYQTGKNHHGALQIVVSPDTSDLVAQALSRHIDIDAVQERRLEMNGPDAANVDVRLTLAGLNRRWRVYRYEPGSQQTFAPHIDAGFPPSSVDGDVLKWDATDEYNGQDIVGRLTVLMYLNDDFVGGETKFYAPSSSDDVLCSIRPQTGSVLVFPQAVGEDAVDYARQHWPLHEGSPVKSGTRPKYVIRSDVLFVQQVEQLDVKDVYSKHDNAVRQTFLPQSPVLDSNFLSHVESLYNPHMGVENLGPLLYSLIRFTKKRTIVEIGAGYTSLWILQALKDNDDELERIRQLGRRGECLLLDIPWAVPDIVEQYDQKPASLLLIDNCKHQKETATGASAVANSLGLGHHMKFVMADAFELSLSEDVDLLWCDFGVGSRMADFCRQAWKSIQPGGFLVCHSTLTNRGTRAWLEAIRSGTANEDETGIPANSYVELSLLEPHKRYQNAITILQKRREGDDADSYEEPIYSQYA